MSKQIITQELLRMMFDYREDGNLIRKISVAPNARKGDVAGSLKKTGYVTIKINRISYLSHRLIFLWHHGYLPLEVDHIDRNQLDSRIENLRAADKTDNRRNVGIRSDNKSGVKGVSWDKKRNKWRAQCSVNGTIHHIGIFANLADADFAVRQFRTAHHGNFVSHG